MNIKTINRIESILAWVRANFPEIVLSQEVFDKGFTAGGQAFDTLCSGGIKRESDPVPLLCITPECADFYYRESLKRYIETFSPGKLCWRTLPVLEEILCLGTFRYFVWSRLCIEKEIATNEDKQKL